MKTARIVFIILLFSHFGMAQVRKVKTGTLPAKYYPLNVKINESALKYTFHRLALEQQKWYSYNRINLNLSEVAFSNWKAGGENSISALLSGRFRRRYTEKTFFWDNELLLNYGINAQKEQGIRKTDDQLEINSTFGYRGRSKSYWYYSSKLNISTQISNGYNYPNREKVISRFMAPGYIILGIGAEYAPKSMNFNIFISPLSLKTTLVLDRDLANTGAFGVKPAVYDNSGNIIKEGRKTNSELGFLVSGSWKTKVYDNIEMFNRFSFYGDYLENFGNIDVDWEFSLNMKVNDYVQARLGTHLKYDDDIKFKEYTNASGKKIPYGARIQLKQILGVGITYTFK